MRTSRLSEAAQPLKHNAPGRGRRVIRTKALPGRGVSVLYTTGAVFKEIRRLFANPTPEDRRVAVVAYVGADALAFLPSPKGIDVVCSPTPLGTSHVGVKKLITRGAKVRVADRLHMKVYWSEQRGCVITSANLSTNALGKGGLREAGVYFPPGAVDIDRMLTAAKPRRLTKADMNRMAQEERKAAAKGMKFQARSLPTSFSEWYGVPREIREDSPKLSSWEADDEVEIAGSALALSKKEYGVTEPEEQMLCKKDELKQFEWLLCVECSGDRFTDVEWMFIDFVVPVDPSDHRAYAKEFPFSAIQVHSHRHYSNPPFSLTADVKRAILDTLTARGLKQVDTQSYPLPEDFLAEVADRAAHKGPTVRIRLRTR